jgi:hypothetical protein
MFENLRGLWSKDTPETGEPANRPRQATDYERMCLGHFFPVFASIDNRQ